MKFLQTANRQFPFILLTLSLFIVLLFPMTLRDGMFMDGQIYACLARNLADGHASFWFPVFSDSWDKNGLPWFLEQPPLGFGMESLAFGLLGSSIYTERIYALFMACLTAFFITRIWNVSLEGHHYRKMFWLPVLFWIIMPVVFWSYQNNMLENTMGMFVACSVWLIMSALKAPKNGWIWLTGGAVSLTCAAFTKGFPGLFPIVLPGILWLVTRKISFYRALIYSTVLCVTPVLVFVILQWYPDAERALSLYLHNRVLNSIENVSNHDTRWYIVGQLFNEILGPLILTILVFSLNLVKSRAKTGVQDIRPIALVFFLLGAAGSLPMMITMEQRGFYLASALPYYAIALAMLSAPGMERFILSVHRRKNSFKILGVLSIILLTGGIVASIFLAGGYKRDEAMLEDVYKIGAQLPENCSIDTDAPTWLHWNLQAYFQRHYHITLEHKRNDSDYYLVDTEHPPEEGIPATYHKMPISGLKRYAVYRHRQ